MTTNRSKSLRLTGIIGVVVLLIGGVGLGLVLATPLRDTWHRLTGSHQHDEATGQLYTCGMHPWVIQAQPGLCPICHMDLTPIDPAKFTGELAIEPVVTQNIGVRVAQVAEGPLTRTIRTIGTVEHDEAKVHDVNLRFAGWIEKVHVDTVGRHVNAGDPLFDIYSPQLLATQQELLIAKNNPDLAQVARDRLLNLGLTDEQIDAVLTDGQPRRVVTMLSPYTGHVIAKNALEGMRVEPATLLFRIADHRAVWVDVVLYEQDLPFVQQGMAATMTLPQLPGRTFEGKVTLLYPHLDANTRQLTVRVTFDNPDLVLKPGMFADVSLIGTLADNAVLVPREAVIDTGQRQVAFVQLEAGRFEPRDVTLGVETGDGRVQVLGGLKPGEDVVVSGQFLLDSEARLRESIAKMLPAHEPAKPAKPTGASDPSVTLREATPGEALTPYPLDTCPVTDLKLGVMGEPVRYAYGDQEILFCCASCPPKFEADPQQYLTKLHALTGKPEAQP